MPKLERCADRIAHGGPLLVVAFGSSTTEGVGASSPDAAYPAVLQHELAAALANVADVRVLNRGVGGENAVDMLARLDRDALEPHPDLVVWQTGSNDALRQDPLDRFTNATREALLRLEKAGADRVVMEPQWSPLLDATPHFLDYLRALRELAAELRAPLYRRYDLMRDWATSGRLTRERMFVEDGLHLRDACYALIGRTLAEQLVAWMGAGERDIHRPSASL